jgi:hypothetical protein
MTSKTILAIGVALFMAACGAAPNAKSAMIKKCVEGGETEAICTCVATEMETTLEPEIFKAMTLEAEGKSEEAQKIMQSLPLGKQLGAATGMIGVMAKCQGAK